MTTVRFCGGLITQSGEQSSGASGSTPAGRESSNDWFLLVPNAWIPALFMIVIAVEQLSRKALMSCFPLRNSESSVANSSFFS